MEILFNRLKKNWLPALLTLIIAIGAYVKWQKNLSPKSKKTTEIATQDKFKKTPTQVNSEPKKQAPLPLSKLKPKKTQVSSTCKDKCKKLFIPLSREQMEKIVAGKNTLQISYPENSCLELKKQYPVYNMIKHSHGFYAGEAIIKKLTPSSKNKTREMTIRIIKKDFGSPMIPEKIFRQCEYQAMSNLKTVSKKYCIYDLRDYESFEKWHLPEARHFPPEELKNNKREFYQEIKTAPCSKLLYGHNQFDPYPYEIMNELLKLNSNANFSIHYAPKGAYGYLNKNNENLETPKTSKSIIIINSHYTFLHLLKKGHYKIFYSNHLKKKSPMSFATFAPYSPQLHPSGIHQLMGKGLTRPKLQEAGDDLDSRVFPKNPLQPIIIIGDSNYDWDAYKTALWLSQTGWLKVLWYRSGYAELQLAYKYDPQFRKWMKANGHRIQPSTYAKLPEGTWK